MGWARTLLLGDIGNRLDIGDAERDIAELGRTLNDKTRRDASQDRRLEQLEAETYPDRRIRGREAESSWKPRAINSSCASRLSAVYSSPRACSRRRTWRSSRI